ncbi:RNA 2',3'-cyclic phosphodiesterase [Ostreiculturibacter nitratireducens]|uniref:RNA 2',3'-cyclic phosphodiesterase n=1 Tax=Ostreiculturibacter nitratireducens TaxID=3075226 RepID=UPI0031B56F93
MIRAFVAIEPSGETLDGVEALQDRLRIGRAVARENLHVTLAFLGEKREDDLEELHHALSSIRAEPFRVRLSGLDFFGGRSPRVLAALVAPEPRLQDLHDKVRRAARAAGMELARERFRPHLTIVRFREGLHGAALHEARETAAREALLTVPDFHVGEFHLYRSTLRRDRPVHDILATYPLG